MTQSFIYLLEQSHRSVFASRSVTVVKIAQKQKSQSIFFHIVIWKHEHYISCFGPARNDLTFNAAQSTEGQCFLTARSSWFRVPAVLLCAVSMFFPCLSWFSSDVLVSDQKKTYFVLQEERTGGWPSCLITFQCIT